MSCPSRSSLDLPERVCHERNRSRPETRLHRNVPIREENAAAALEVMSRFCRQSEVADPSAADDVAERPDVRTRLPRSQTGCGAWVILLATAALDPRASPVALVATMPQQW